MNTAASDVVRRAFETQARSCAHMGSPFTAALCNLLPERLDLTSAFGRRILGWPETAGPDALPLRACGALHALARSGQEPELTAAYPPASTDNQRLWPAIQTAISVHDLWLADYLDSAPQTNEVARSSILLGAALIISNQTKLPLQIHEVGASAGLNLRFDQYRYDFGELGHWGAKTSPLEIAAEWRGDAPSLDKTIEVVSRRGCDRNPLDPALANDAGRLLSYVWPDQAERVARLSAAIDLAKENATDNPAMIDKVDAADWVEGIFDGEPVEGRVQVLWHTVVWQYLPEVTKNRITTAIRKAGNLATDDAPIAHFAFENDLAGHGGCMKLTLWPGGETKVLGRADFHGRWVEWS